MITWHVFVFDFVLDFLLLCVKFRRSLASNLGTKFFSFSEHPHTAHCTPLSCHINIMVQLPKRVYRRFIRTTTQRPKQQHSIFPPTNIMTLPLSRAQSRQRHNTENDLRRPRASIRDLQQLIDTSLNSYSSPLVPARLLSSINHCAILEDQSNLSNEMYESVVQDMVSFMSSTIASFGKSFESEGVYNPELLNMCEFILG